MTVESVIELRPIGHVAEGIEREIFSTEDDVEAAGAIHAVWRIAWGAEDEVVDAIAIEIDDDGIHEARAESAPLPPITRPCSSTKPQASPVVVPVSGVCARAWPVPHRRATRMEIYLKVFIMLKCLKAESLGL